VYLGEWLDGAADLVLGARCAGCGLPGRGPCRECRQLLRETPPLVVGAAGQAPAVVAAGRYEGVLKSILIAAKERGALGSLPVLGQRLAVSVTVLASAASCRMPVVLVPVPSVPASVAERGLDFTAALARIAAAQLRAIGVSAVVARGLSQVRRPDDQAGLGVLARQANLSGAFRATRLPGGEVIVVDDIVTTGASLAEAARALAAAGRLPLGAATVAATMRRANP
jgi:predicted amidophosphoribosyltransferase